MEDWTIRIRSRIWVSVSISVDAQPLDAVIVFPNNKADIKLINHLVSIKPHPVVSEGISVQYSVIVAILQINHQNVPSVVPMAVEMFWESSWEIYKFCITIVSNCVVIPWWVELIINVLPYDCSVFWAQITCPLPI